ncbi:EF-hand and zinc finger domain containing protein [Sarcoptes scabiei]|uniref:EF-hand and zinc finger domain containing protein n=1 Tax=Sarcoptes scabiei TaxID=52283 RepID=A0A131ZW92_SARSC|nr:EF-hand and zinc finger domain containing protein [Sarcoptes scabiei]
MDDLATQLHEAEMVQSNWVAIDQIQFDEVVSYRDLLKIFNRNYVVPVSRDIIHVNEIAARLTGRNVPISYENLNNLEHLTTRARMLRIALDERFKQLDQILINHDKTQQHFLTDAVEEPWERAVTNNKLPCYINRQTESVHSLSPNYTQIIQSLNSFNDVRYAAYRTAMKLRHLQIKLGLDLVTLTILVDSFEKHGLTPNNIGHEKIDDNNDVTVANNSLHNNNNRNNNQKQNSKSKSSQESFTKAKIPSSMIKNKDLPYELRLISVPEIVSCLKMIFETVRTKQILDQQQQSNGHSKSTKSKSKSKSSSEKSDPINFESSSPSTMIDNSDPKRAVIDVPNCVDLCLNWLLDLYDSLISDTNHQTDEQHLGLLIYDCLRLAKLLGEVAAFGGTNVEPSVRSCMEMAQLQSNHGMTIENILNWIRAEPQSLVWLVVLHRLRLAEKNRHPAKCNCCRRYPIIGFRYRCLKCFNFDLCQQCFLLDKSTKKHKSTHPMQEYCVVNSSGEDIRDFAKILRNKFKSAKHLKRNQALGYLPVQSLHEGDRIVESALNLVHTGQGSFSHAPSSNTTPIHTLSYPIRSPSPGLSLQQDIELVLDSKLNEIRQQSSSKLSSPQASSNHYSNDNDIYGIRSIPARTLMDSNFDSSGEQSDRESSSKFHRPTTISASHHSDCDDENRTRSERSYQKWPFKQNRSQSIPYDQMNKNVHQRMIRYAKRLAKNEHQTNRSKSSRSSRPQNDLDGTLDDNDVGTHRERDRQPPPRRSSFDIATRDSFPFVQSPTEMLSKLALDQRNELEVIIKRLQDENRFEKFLLF